MNTLESFQLKEIKIFCQNYCQKIVNEKDKKDLEKQRGRYKGFTYGIKTVNFLLSQNNIKNTKTELYQHFKMQQQIVQCSKFKEGNFNEGMKESLYKIMNFVSGL